MASTDIFSYESSMEPQSIDAVSPYVEKNYNNINDINSGVYSNNGLSLVQFDLSSIYNSVMFTDTNDAFLTIPIVMAATWNSGTTAANVAPATPPTAGSNLLTMKNSFVNLIHQMEIQSGGQVISDMQPFTNVLKNFKLFSTLTATDLAQISPSYGMATELDSQQSQKWLTTPFVAWDGTTAATSTLPGVGLTNNQAFLNGVDTFATGVGPSSYSGVQSVCGPKDCFTTNASLQKRISRVTAALDSTSSSLAKATATNVLSSNIWANAQNASGKQPCIMTANDLAQEFKSYYTTQAITTGGTAMVWYDMAVIPIKFLADCFRSIGLSRKLDMQMRLYVNTGTISIPVQISTAGYAQYGVPTGSTFANTVPFTVNTLPLVGSVAAGTLTDGFPLAAALLTASFGTIVCGLFIAKSATTSIALGGGTVVNFSGLSNPMPSCRFYFSQIRMSPSRSVAYVSENRQKSCVYEQFIFNQYNSIASQGTFSQLVQSGIRDPLALCVIPFISNTTPTLVGGATQLGLTQYGSPFDTSPSSYAPISLTNLQVTLGGTQVLKSGSLSYTFENFLEQVQLADSVVAGIGAANIGVITQQWWESNRVYWVDLSRSEDASKSATRNLVLSFKNNTEVIIDLMVFTIYSSKIVVDVESGATTLL